MNISNLRSPGDKVGGLVYFGRMLDKIRLHASRETPGRVSGKSRLRLRWALLLVSWDRLRGAEAGKPRRRPTRRSWSGPTRTAATRPGRKSRSGRPSCASAAGTTKPPLSCSGACAKAALRSAPISRRCSTTSIWMRAAILGARRRLAHGGLRKPPRHRTPARRHGSAPQGLLPAAHPQFPQVIPSAATTSSSIP